MYLGSQADQSRLKVQETFTHIRMMYWGSILPCLRVRAIQLSIYDAYIATALCVVGKWIPGYRVTILTLSGYTEPTLVKTRSDAVSTKGVIRKSAAARTRSMLMSKLACRSVREGEWREG